MPNNGTSRTLHCGASVVVAAEQGRRHSGGDQTQDCHRRHAATGTCSPSTAASDGCCSLRRVLLRNTRVSVSIPRASRRAQHLMQTPAALRRAHSRGSSACEELADGGSNRRKRGPVAETTPRWRAERRRTLATRCALKEGCAGRRAVPLASLSGVPEMRKKMRPGARRQGRRRTPAPQRTGAR